MKDSAKPVGALRNIGPKSATMLASTGIRTLGELRVLGPVKTYIRLKTAFPKRVSLNMLWSLAAGSRRTRLAQTSRLRKKTACWPA